MLHFDGGIRDGVMAFGFCAYCTEKRANVLFAGNGKCGEGTSNIAEYRALINGLMACLNRGIKKVHVVGDSQLIINQVNKTWRVNNSTLIEHRDRVWELLEEFESWTIKWVPRRQNQVADALASEALDRGGKKCEKRNGSS